MAKLIGRKLNTTANTNDVVTIAELASLATKHGERLNGLVALGWRIVQINHDPDHGWLPIKNIAHHRVN